MTKRLLIALALILTLTAPAATFAATKKKAPPAPKKPSWGLTWNVCRTYAVTKANTKARKYPTISQTVTAIQGAKAAAATLSLCAGNYAEDVVLDGATNFRFLGHGGTTTNVRGAGVNEAVFHLLGSGSLDFENLNISAAASSTGETLTAVWAENPEAKASTVSLVSANIEGFPQALHLKGNANLTLDKSAVSHNPGGVEDITIDVEGSSCAHPATVSLNATEIASNTGAQTWHLVNVNFNSNDSSMGRNVDQGFLNGSCHRLTAFGSTFYLNQATIAPLFVGDASSTLLMRATGVLRNVDTAGDDFAQGYAKVTIDPSCNVSQNSVPGSN
jgi:hypothetical protein